MYLDFSKVFDLVDISILLDKTRDMGISGNMLMLLICLCFISGLKII